MNEVLAGPNDAITEQQRSALIRLAQHFGLLSKGDNESGDGSDKEDDGSDKEDDGSDKEDNDSDEEMNDSDKDNDDSGDSPKPRKPTKTSRHPWAPFMRLKKVVLAYSIEHHLRQYGPDAEKFLSDDDLLKHKIFECAEDAVSDKFMAYYEYTLQLAARRSKDGIRWCFSMLMYFDLVKVVKPKSSGKKVGRLMLKDIIKFLGESSTLDPKMAYKNMNKWAGFGRKLDLLCTTFGPGCIFYLVDFFSTNL